jgi:hypothetical protein
LAGVDSVGYVLKEVVDDMAGSETERWGTGVEVLPVVVGVCNGKMALVFSSVAVRMTDKRALVMVMHEGVGDSDEVTSVSDVQKTVIEVLLTRLELA